MVGARRGRRRRREDPAGRRRDATIIGVRPRGALHTGRDDYEAGSMNAAEALVRRAHEPERRATARRADVIEGTDVFIGLSGPGVIAAEALQTMNPRPDRVRDGQPEPGGARPRRPRRTCA